MIVEPDIFLHSCYKIKDVNKFFYECAELITADINKLNDLFNRGYNPYFVLKNEGTILTFINMLDKDVPTSKDILVIDLFKLLKAVAS